MIYSPDVLLMGTVCIWVFLCHVWVRFVRLGHYLVCRLLCSLVTLVCPSHRGIDCSWRNIKKHQGYHPPETGGGKERDVGADFTRRIKISAYLCRLFSLTCLLSFFLVFLPSIIPSPYGAPNPSTHKKAEGQKSGAAGGGKHDLWKRKNAEKIREKHTDRGGGLKTHWVSFMYLCVWNLQQ